MSDPQPYRPSPTELQAMIRGLRPDRELYSGRRFFEKLLHYHGVDGVMSFVERAQKALSEEGELDLYFNFNDKERELFQKVGIKSFTRRSFFGVSMSGFSGAVFAGHGGLQLLDKLERNDWSSRTVAEAPTMVQKGLRVTNDIYPFAEVAIGGTLIYEGGKNKFEEKLEQIADAVSVLAEKLEEKQPKASRA